MRVFFFFWKGGENLRERIGTLYPSNCKWNVEGFCRNPRVQQPGRTSAELVTTSSTEQDGKPVQTFACPSTIYFVSADRRVEIEEKCRGFASQRLLRVMNKAS